MIDSESLVVSSRRTTTGDGLLAFLVALVLASALVHVAHPDGVFGEVSYLVALGLAGVAAWRGVAAREAATRGPWALVATGITLSASADLVYVALRWTTGAQPDVSVADVLWLGSYVALAMGIARLTPSRQGVDVDAILDCLVGAVVGLFLLWELSLADLVADDSIGWMPRLVWAAYPLLDVVLLSLLIRALIIHRGTRSPCMALLAAGVTCWLVADVGFLLVGGGAADVWLDVGWMLALLLLGVATSRRQAEPDIEQGEVPVRMWAVMLPLLVPGLFELRGFLIDEDPNPVPLLATTGALVALIALRCHRLVADLREAQRAVESRERHFQSLAANAADAVVVLDTDGRIVEGAAQLARLLSVDESLVDQASALDARALVDEPAVRVLYQQALSSPGTVFDEEIQIRPIAGQRRWLGARMVNLAGDPDVCGIVVNLQDITDRKRMEEQLIHQAFHDSLTGVANRALLADRIEHALRRGGRTGADPAIIYLDVDGFKGVNDRLGHEAGDALLKETAARLVRTVRSEDTVARLGGDEFAVLIEENHQHADEARTTAERIVQVMSVPIEIGDELIAVSASMGVAVATPLSTASSLLRDADIAMYRAKAGGKAQVIVYDVEMGTEAGEALQLEADLACAVERGELELFYQPVVDLADERVVGFEALLRWWHPRLGLVGPDRFIPIAERTGLILPIGRWVLETACAWAARWQHGDGPAAVTMAVNVSARQLASDDIVLDVADALSSSGLDPSLLVLEMTESALVEDPEETAHRLGVLKQLGPRIAIDDFGTGFSSLSYLRQFPVDILKIDRSFIETITEDDPLPPIVRGLLDLGHTLDLEIVAEGIELDIQRSWLRDQSCGFGQGFLFARPLSASDAERLLDQTTKPLRST